MSTYFQRFPTIQYDIYGNGNTLELIDISRTVRIKPEIKDDIILYTHYVIQDGERPDNVSMKLYGSQEYYWTFFMVNDNLINIHEDWPLSREELDNKVQMKYSGNVLKTFDDISNLYTKGEIIRGLQSGATATILEKDPNLGLIKISTPTKAFKGGEVLKGQYSNDICVIDSQIEFKYATHHYENSEGLVVPSTALGAYEVTNAEYEQNENERKSTIRVIKREYINQVSAEFFKLINPEE